MISISWVKSNQKTTKLIRLNNNLQTSPNRLVGIEALSKQHFRLQDLSIEIQSTNSNGASIYGAYLDGCSNYSLSRVHIITGDAGNGISGTSGTDGINGQDGVDGEPGMEVGDSLRNGGIGGSGSFTGSNSGGTGGTGGERGTYRIDTNMVLGTPVTMHMILIPMMKAIFGNPGQGLGYGIVVKVV